MQPLFEKEYVKVMNERKKRKMMFCAYSIAVTGNIAKVYAHAGSPFAINAAEWFQFVREAISQAIIYFSNTNDYIDIIQNRHLIDETFEKLLKNTSMNYCELSIRNG